MTTRRKKGSGTLRHLDGDRWRYQFRHEGDPLSRVFRAANATEAEKATASIRVELIAEHNAKRDASGVERERRQEWTVERYADYYLDKWARVHLAPSTFDERKRVIEKSIKPSIGKMRMADVTATTLQELYGRLEKRAAYGKKDGSTLAGATIWKVHTAIRALFTFAVEVEEDFATSPAAKKTARPKVAQTGSPRRAVDVEEVERFVALVREQKPEIVVPVMLSAWLGTRRSETLALRRRDFDLEAGTVQIRRSVTQSVDGTLEVKEWVKNERPREVPLDAHTVAIMRGVFQRLSEGRLAFGTGWRGGKTPGDDWVCADGSGGMLEPNHFNAVFRAFVKKHELKMTPHLLRHALVSQLIAQGLDAVTISGITGHSPAVLLKTYAHAFDSRKREAIDTLGEAREVARAAQG